MSGESKHPSEQELDDIEKNIMTPTEREQSAEREQREFEKNTREGFLRLQKLLNGPRDELIRETNKIIDVLPTRPITPQAIHPYLITHELLGAERPFSKEDREFLRGENINVAEIAGSNIGSTDRGDKIWPSREGFVATGANYFGTDVQVDKEETIVEDDQTIATLQVNALNPDEKLKDRFFDLVYSIRLFGKTAGDIAISRSTEEKKVYGKAIEAQIFEKWDKHIRPGGFFVAGSDIPIRPEEAKKHGYDSVVIPSEILGFIYFIARKKGMYENEESAGDQSPETLAQAA